MKKPALIFIFLIFGLLISAKSILALPVCNNANPGGDCGFPNDNTPATCTDTCVNDGNASRTDLGQCECWTTGHGALISRPCYQHVYYNPGSVTAGLNPAFSWSTNNKTCSGYSSNTQVLIRDSNNCTGNSMYLTPSAMPANYQGATLTSANCTNSAICTNGHLYEGKTYSWSAFGLSPNSEGNPGTACQTFTTLSNPPTSVSTTLNYAGTRTTNLAGYWKLDETTGTTAADSSGNNNTGTLTGTPSIVTGKVNNARTFNGTNYITIPENAGLHATATGLTLSAWVNPGSFIPYSGIIHKSNNFILRYDNIPKVACYLFLNGSWSARALSDNDLPTDTWTHVACVWGNNTITLYINGVAQNQPAAASGTINAPSDLTYIGYSWDGSIDEARVYNTALSTPEIGDLFKDNGTVNPDGSTQYKITVTSSDVEGGGDIMDQYVLINPAGSTNAYQYHGGLTWSLDNFPIWQPPFKQLVTTPSGTSPLGQCALTLPSSGTGSRAISELVSCTNNVSGQTRTNTFTVKFGDTNLANNPFFVPVTGNTLSGLAYDYSNLSSGNWTQGSSFNLVSGLTCQAPTGLVAWWKMNENANQTVGDFAGPHEGTATNDNYHGANLSAYWNFDTAGTTLGSTVTDSTGTNPGTVNGTSCTLGSTALNYGLLSFFKADDTTNGPTANGLISYWKLDETAVGPAVDSSGNGYTGTATGTSVAGGKINNARNFNGSTEYIAVSNPLNQSSVVSASFWFNPTRIGNGGTNGYSSYLLSKMDDGTNNFFIEYRNTGSFELGTNDNAGTYRSYVISSNLSAINQWHHVAFTITSGGTVTTYLDGNQVNQPQAMGAWNTGTDQLRIGTGTTAAFNPNAYGQYFLGAIDEVRIYNTVLSGNQLSDLFKQPEGFADSQGPNSGTGSGLGCNFKAGGNYNNNLSASLVSYWKMDEAAGATINDTMGINPGTATGTTNYGFSPDNLGTLATNLRSYWKLDEVPGIAVYPITDSGPAGLHGTSGWGACTPQAFAGQKLGNSFYFPCSGGVVEGINNVPTTNTTDWTMAAWVKLNNLSSAYQIFAYNGVGGTNGYGLGLLCGDCGCGNCSLTPGKLAGYFGGVYSGNVINGQFDSGYRFTDTNWHFVVMTRTAADGITRFYVDKVLTTITTNVAPLAPSSAFKIGVGNTVFGNYWTSNTYLDEVGVWSKALAQQEINDLYNNGVGNPYNNPGAAVVAGKLGNARSFNGSNTYIDISNSTAFDVSTYTISAWVYSSNYSQNGFIFEKGPVNSQYSLFFEGGNVVQRSYNSAGTIFINQYTAVSTAGISNGNWYHLASVYDGAFIKLYVNGSLKSNIAVSGTLRTGQIGQRIGAYGGGAPAYFFNGTIDEVGVWNRALSGAEITQLANNPTGLACDAGPVIATGKIGSAKSFGGNDLITLSSTSNLNFSNYLTVSAWIYPKDCSHAGSNYNPIVTKENGFLIGLNTGCNMQNWVNINGGTWIAEPVGPYVSPNAWHHVVVVYDGTRLWSYLDNANVGGGGAGTAAAGTLSSFAYPIQIGNRGSGTNQTFNGYIDEVGIWSRNLVPSEVSSLYNATAGLTCTPQVNGNNLAATGKYSTGINLNGYNDYISIPNNASLTSSSYTVSLWLNIPKQNEYWKGIFGKAGPASARDFQMWLGNANGDTAFIHHRFHSTGSTNDGCPNSGSFTFNSWHHIVITNDGSTCETWIDGARSVFGSVNGAMVPDAGTTYIGRNLDGGSANYLAGQLDEIGFWSRALPASEIQDLWANFPRYNKMLSSGPTPSTQNKLGGYSRLFNGLTDYINVPDNLALNSPTMTVGGWVYPTSFIPAAAIYNRRTASNLGGVSMEIADAAGHVRCWFTINNVWQSVTSTSPLNINTWNYVACSYNGANIQSFINPVSGAYDSVSPSLPGSITNPAGTILVNIGRNLSNKSLLWQGNIDELRVFNRALTSSEIAVQADPVNQFISCSPCTGNCIDGTGYKTCTNSYCQVSTQICTDFTITPVTITGQLINPPTTQPNVCILNGSTCDPARTYSTSGNTYSVGNITTVGTYNVSLDNTTNLNPDKFTVNVTCGSLTTITGPAFWYNSSAGIPIQWNLSPNTIRTGYLGSGKASQNGTGLGFRVEGNSTGHIDLSRVNYSSYLGTTLATYPPPTGASDPCLTLNQGVANGSNKFYCYDAGVTGTLDTAFNNAISTGVSGATSGINVIYVQPGKSGPQTLTAKNIASAGGKHFIIFVNGNLTVNGNITDGSTPPAVSTANSTDIFMINGDLTLAGTVTRLDGAFVFSGNLDDGSTATALVGRGSLIQTGVGSRFGLNRTVDRSVGVAETWYFEPKYLDTYKSTFYSPQFTWQELPPQ